MMKATEKNYVMKSKSKKEVPDDREKRKNERNKKLSLEQGCGSGFTWIQEGQFEGKNWKNARKMEKTVIIIKY